MRLIGAMIVALGATGSTLAADVPNVKGAWQSDFDFVIIGNNIHHPGGDAVTDPPRSGTISFTFDIEGQDGARAWGKSWSKPEKKEPFALVIAPDGKTAIGSDTDGVLNFTIMSPDSLQICYAHAGTSPSNSIVASCGLATKK